MTSKCSCRSTGNAAAGSPLPMTRLAGESLGEMCFSQRYEKLMHFLINFSCKNSICIAIRERKTGLQKSRKARKRPTIALHGPLPPFRDIYPWTAKGLEIGHFSRCTLSGRQNRTKQDKTGQFWTEMDRNGQKWTLQSWGQSPVSTSLASIH